MSDNITISVVIPVHNTPSEWLKECVESILGQDFDNFEILLIDDGSDLSCAFFCDELASYHPKMRVIHQNNRGVSAARNVGIENALGDYITFIDSDDKLEGDFFSKTLSLAREENADAVFGCHIEVYGQNERNRSFGWNGNSVVFSSERQLSDLKSYFFSYCSIKGSGIPSCLARSLHAKMYRASALSGVRFDERLSFLEDGIFNSDFCSTANRIILSDCSWYIYRVNSSSAWHTVNLCAQIDTHAKILKKHAAIVKIPHNFEYAHICGFVFMALIGSAQCGRLSFSDVRKCLSNKEVVESFRGVRLSEFSMSFEKKMLYRTMRYRSSVLACLFFRFKIAFDRLKGKGIE